MDVFVALLCFAIFRGLREAKPSFPALPTARARSAPVDPVPCTRPTWVIIVSEPLPVDAIVNGDPTPIAPGRTERKDANRVVVSINGGGDATGAGGGLNQISITAGGTVRQTIDANSVQGAPLLLRPGAAVAVR